MKTLLLYIAWPSDNFPDGISFRLVSLKKYRHMSAKA